MARTPRTSTTGHLYVVSGAGASDADFSDFGDEAGDRERAVLLDDSLDVIDGLLRGDHVTHEGPGIRVDAELHITPVQRPRPPIWVAAVAPNQRPLRRSARWDGVAPIGEPFLAPDALAAYVAPHVRAGWDVVAARAPGFGGRAYAAVGASWLVDSTYPGDDDWVQELRERIAAGPQE